MQSATRNCRCSGALVQCATRFRWKSRPVVGARQLRGASVTTSGSVCYKTMRSLCDSFQLFLVAFSLNGLA